MALVCAKSEGGGFCIGSNHRLRNRTEHVPSRHGLVRSDRNHVELRAETPGRVDVGGPRSVPTVISLMLLCHKYAIDATLKAAHT